MKPGLVMAYASVMCMLAVIVLAWLDDMLLPSQMVTQRYHNVGFPLVANGAIWANLVLMSAILYVIGTYVSQWNNKEVWLALAFGMAISYALFHFIYLKGKFPDALAGGGMPISPAGLATMAYSAAVIAAILMFYLRTSALWADVVWVGVLLALYIPVANHAVLGWLNSWYSFPWCPRIFAEESTPLRFIIGGEILVVVGTTIKLLW